MPYGIESIEGRFHVTSPKGKLWKTTYKSKAAAQKAVAYIEGRFGGGSTTPPASSDGVMIPTSGEEQYQPPEGERGAKTLMRLRYMQDEEGF